MNQMVRSRADGRWRRLAAAAVALYAVFLTTTPFEHHDLLCHLKTPQHCTSCSSSPLSVNPHTPDGLDTVRFADAGCALVADTLSEGALLVTASSGRSPPLLLPFAS
jgi:hypothetical protein